MTATQDFQQDPVGFLRNNIVVPYYANSVDLLKKRHETASLLGGLQTLTLRLSAETDVGYRPGRFWGWTFAGKKIDVFKIDYGVGKAEVDRMRAYWCPYVDDYTMGVCVSNGADFMFTPTMDGCSLGIGSVGNDGSRLVYHANVRGPDQEDAQTLNLTAHNANDMVLHPSAYRGQRTHGSITAVGWRHNGVWEFYYQVQEQALRGSQHVWRLCGVNRVQ